MKLVLRGSTPLLVVAVAFFASVMAGCKSKSSSQGATAQSPGQAASQNPPAQQSQNPPAQQLSIDDLVAPIALYPDQLLAQVLTTSVNPQEVLDLGNWLLQNQNLQGDAMTNAAKQAGFSASAQYLALFPQVVDNMCQQMDWTRQLGEAFKADQKAVMDAVQRKRVQAQQMGNLNSSSQMTVENKKADNGQPYVAIQPANPQVVYVPQYNPVTIYNTPPPAAPASSTTTTATESSGVSTGAAVAVGLLSFGVGMAVGSAINNNNYYPYPAWGYHSVYVVNRPYYPAAYRPPVYPGYRPAYGYHPPANYHYKARDRFVSQYDAKHSLVKTAPHQVTLNVGTDDWPLPIPLVEANDKWYWDGAAGREEILYRRIGHNELAAIKVCEGVVAAQRDYASTAHDGQAAGTYAPKLVSDAGKKNGLYWEVAEGENPSPAGPLLAQANAEGYDTSGKRTPYHGYYYRMLKNPGGFGFLAYPAEYRSSGVMTFIVNQTGVMYQKDLGENTAEIARQMTDYKRDSTWARVK